ncbi:MAG: hypothetical protein JW854_09490 [Actinobacteria bacterium]|nr:hypothetical protein [Actinomycetota bacterium]
MAGTFERSTQILKESLGVLKQDKELVLFPIISGIVMLILTASFVVPLVMFTGIKDGEVENNVLYYVFFFLFYLVGYFVVIFFNTGLIACVQIRLSGGDPKFSDGMQYAVGNLGKIAGWALISATVGLVLQMIRERAGLLGRIAAGLFGMAWNLITFFVIPVMIFQNAGVIDSIKQSAALFKRTWGENVVLRFSLGLIMFLLGLLGIIPIALAIMTKSAAVIIVVGAVVVLYWFALGIISSALNGIFATALYNYAMTGTVPSAFSPAVISSAFGQKTTSGFFSR